MKPKSFKSNGAIANPDSHHIFNLEDIVIKGNWIEIKALVDESSFSVVLDGGLDDHAALGPDLASGDVVAVAIDDDRDVLMAMVDDIKQNGQLRSRLVEYKQQEKFRSSNPLSSARWTSFLEKLKKKCGSDHHNKKRKTLLHVIKMAKAREAKPESIQLTVRREETANTLDENTHTQQDLVARIQAVIDEAAVEGRPPLDLDDLERFLPSGVVDDAEYAPIQTELGAKTFVMNGVSFERGVDGCVESITISAEDLRQALYFNTKPESENPESEDRDRILDDVLDEWSSSNKEQMGLSVYIHNTGVMVYQNKPVKNIKKLSNRDYKIELEASLYAGRLAGVSDIALVTITSYQAVGNDIINETFALAPEILSISPENYEFESVSNTNGSPPTQWFQINHPNEQLMSQFKKDDTYLVSVGGINAAFRVDSVKTDANNQRTLDVFSYQGGGQFDLLKDQLKNGKVLNMKQSLRALPKAPAAMMLTLERVCHAYDDTDEPAAALPEPAPSGNPEIDDPSTGDDDLAEIADGIDELLQDDGEVGLSKVVDWFEQNPRGYPALVVAGAEYKPKQLAYDTKSSVTSGLKIDVWASKSGEYSLFDLKTKDLSSNWQSVVHSSTIVDELPEPESEVKIERFAQLVDEVRQAALDEVKREKLDEVDLDPSKQQELYDGVFLSIYSEELYNGEEGYTVCNNEEIHKILRKKKDGKCIYRIVVKNGAMANRIYHGKHGKCIMYIDRQKSLS